MSERLRVALVHYHLKRGGVTRVIESTLRAADACMPGAQFVVLAGEVPAEVTFSERAITIEGLQYSNAQVKTPGADALLAQIERAATKALGGPPHVWHIHNHSLGKNTALPDLVKLLAAKGAPLLLQMHDFAEDGRPGNYAALHSPEQLYPAAPHLHYATINARDHAYVHSMGLPPEQLHLLPNPVEGSAARHDFDTNTIRRTLLAERLILYPVRAVRRKNFGEMLLWSALAEPGDLFATTLGPTNQNYVQAYQHWQSLAHSLKLPVRFGIGESNTWPFESIIQSASAILNTSIAEGFGLAFLEPWLFGKAIIGRDLPAITADFKAKGLQLDTLYPALAVPAAWIDCNALEAKIGSGLQAAYRTYGLALPQDATERALQAITLPAGQIDFGGLDEAQQTAIITRVAEDPESHKAIHQRLPHHLDQSTRIQHNSQIVCQHYGLEHYAGQLHQIYLQLRQTTPQQPCTALEFYPSQQLLKSFLKPENFRLLRTG
ncbi:MAG: glycosyltransferase involved in cell wall biosynthesis [Lentimonas sp.]|jgi:glycosyltransferase involved in cell wall biosynthesis